MVNAGRHSCPNHVHQTHKVCEKNSYASLSWAILVGTAVLHSYSKSTIDVKSLSYSSLYWAKLSELNTYGKHTSVVKSMTYSSLSLAILADTAVLRTHSKDTSNVILAMSDLQLLQTHRWQESEIFAKTDHPVMEHDSAVLLWKQAAVSFNLTLIWG